MSVDTKIHILMVECDLNKTIKKVMEVLKEKLPVLSIEHRVTHNPAKYDDADADTREKSRLSMYEHGSIDFVLNYKCDEWDDGKEHRSMWYNYDFYTQERLLYLSVGCWGHNEKIARCLVDNFGGYADFSDCDDIGIDYAKPQPKVKEPA